MKHTKRSLSLCLASLLLFSSCTSVADDPKEAPLQAKAPDEQVEYVVGDLDGSGNVDIADALLLFMHSMLEKEYPINYPGGIDFNKDGNVDIGDALRLFMYSMIPDEYPLEEDVTPPETEAPIETEAPSETEAPEPPVNYQGDCGNIFWNKSDQKMGVMCLDHFRHQVERTEYRQNVVDGKVTVAEDAGIFEITGWTCMNFTDFELAWRIGTNSNEKYRTQGAYTINREQAVYDAAKSLGYSNATGFAFHLDISNFKSGEEVHLLMKDKATDTTYCFCEITVGIKSAESVDTEALREKYKLGKDSDMDLSAYDPISNHESVTAPNDDPAVKIWFDHLTEKVTRYDTAGKDSGKTSYTIQMAKNETEGCQFLLYSPTARKVAVKISDFENDKGEKLQTELGVQFYIDDAYLPYFGYPTDYVYSDAVVPYDSYIAYSSGSEHGVYGNDAKSKLKYGPYICIGPFSGSSSDHTTYPFRDSVRGFVVQASATKDTTPGAYKATIEIIDNDTGACIKMANVYTYVYDVTLSDETALDTAFGLWDIAGIYRYHYSLNSKLTQYSDQEIVRATADFFLKHRITLTGGLSYFNDLGEEWFEDPRVTSVRVLTKDQYDRIKDNPALTDKMFFYGQDEPAVPRGVRPIGWPDGTNETVFDNTGLLSVMAVAREADQLKNVWGWEDYRMVIPFGNTLDFTTFDFNSVDKVTAFPDWYDEYAVTNERDSIEYLADAITIWNPKFTAATPRELAPIVFGEEYIQTIGQDELLGECQSRMESYQEKGAELWYYVSCEPNYTAPYQNILLFNDGTEGRTMFWTTYMLGGTGFLYWHVSYYEAAGTNIHTLRVPFSKTGPGDGILIYPGSAYGQLDPIPSIRLINMRDGIEDYQMLTMLKELKGDAYTDELVSHIVTSTVTFTRDDDVVYNAHSYLLRALEEASKN